MSRDDLERIWPDSGFFRGGLGRVQRESEQGDSSQWCRPAAPSPESVSGPPSCISGDRCRLRYVSALLVCARRRLWCRPAAPSPELASGPLRIYLATCVVTDTPLVAPLPSGRGRFRAGSVEAWEGVVSPRHCGRTMGNHFSTPPRRHQMAIDPTPAFRRILVARPFRPYTTAAFERARR